MKGTISAAQAAYVKFMDSPIKAGELLVVAEKRAVKHRTILTHNMDLDCCWYGVRVGLYWAANGIVPQGASASEWRSMLRNKM